MRSPRSCAPRASSTIALLLLSAASICSISDADAQQGRMVSVPAEKYAVTPTGVDMRTGGFVYTNTDLSIGTDPDTGLALVRSMTPFAWQTNAPFGNFSNNFDVMIREQRGAPGENGTVIAYRMFVHRDGRTETFDAYNPTGGFSYSSAGQEARLTWSGDRSTGSVIYTYTADDGTEISFRPLGSASSNDCAQDAFRCAYPSRIVKPDGTTLTFTYGGTGNGGLVRLLNVVSNRGFGMVFEADVGGALVTKACVLNLSRSTMPSNNRCPAGAPAATYTYNAGRLASATDPLGATSSIAYGPASYGYTMALTNPADASPWQTVTFRNSPNAVNAPAYAVASQSFASGTTYNYQWQMTPATDGTQTIAGGNYSDQFGHGYGYAYGFPVKPLTGIDEDCNRSPCREPMPDDPVQYQQTSGPVEIEDALGRSITADYCDPVVQANLAPNKVYRCAVGNLRSFTDAEGIRTELSYDGTNVTEVRRKPKPGSTLADIVTKATYDCLTSRKFCTKPQTTTDARGAVTHYAYSADHGGMTMELQPPPTVGAARPLKLYDYVQRQAYVLNGVGQLIASGTSVWLPATETQCQTVANFGPGAPSGRPACDTSEQKTVITYEYGANGSADNLLLRGKVVTADGQSRRTCMVYDARGNKIAETTPRAGLTTCS